jgi:hypothetical protein
LGSGDLFSMHLGGEDNEWEFLLAGSPFEQLASGLDISNTGKEKTKRE